MHGLEHLSLAAALKSGRLPEFIRQEEARGIGPVTRAEFDTATAALIKAPQSKGRTLRSSSGDGSTGKKTPRDSGPDASG